MSSRTLMASGLLALTLVTVPTLSEAATFQWINPTGGDWDQSANWSPAGYPTFFFDLADFSTDAVYTVDASDPTMVAPIAALQVRGGEVTLLAHTGMGGVLSVGATGTPGTFVLGAGVLEGAGVHQVGPLGTVILNPGTRWSSRATGSIGFLIESGGLVAGDGSIERQVFRNRGTLSPGLAFGQAGTLSFGTVQPAGLFLEPSSEIHIDVTPTGADRIDVVSTSTGVTLDGTLVVSKSAGFAPPAGTEFEILRSPTSLAGAFDSIVLPEDGSLTLRVESDRLVLVAAETATPVVIAQLDANPEGCVDPLGRRKQGQIWLTLLGSGDLPVGSIDASSITVNGLAPEKTKVKDTAGPGDFCGCSSDGADGYDDLRVRVDAGALMMAVDPTGSADEVTVTLTAELADGTPVEATGCLQLRGAVQEPVAEQRGQEKPSPRKDGFRAGPGLIGTDSAPIARFSLEQSSSVRLEVFDVAGRLVRVIEDGTRGAGDHSIEWDANGLAAGVYFYRLQTERSVDTAKLVLTSRASN